MFTRTYREMVLLFAEGLSDKVIDRARRWADEVADAMNGELSSIQGNERCKQVSFGAAHRVSGELVPRTLLSGGFNRGRHQRYVAAINTVIAANLDMKHSMAMAFIFGGLIHDEGHYPFGHSTDYAIRAHNPSNLGHEFRMINVLQLDFYANALNRAGTNANDVLSVIHEKSKAGSLQRLTDTVGYCYMDPQALGFYDAWQPDFLGEDVAAGLLNMVREFIASIQGVAPGNVPEVDDLVTVRNVLTVRKHLYRYMYYNAYQQLAIAGLNRIVALALDSGILNLSRFASAVGDDGLEEMFKRVFEREELKGYRQWFQDVWSLTEGPLSKERWTHHGCEFPSTLEGWKQEQDADLLDRALMFTRKSADVTVKEVIVKCGASYELVSPRCPNEGELFNYKYHVWLPNFVG